MSRHMVETIPTGFVGNKLGSCTARLIISGRRRFAPAGARRVLFAKPVFLANRQNGAVMSFLLPLACAQTAPDMANWAAVVITQSASSV